MKNFLLILIPLISLIFNSCTTETDTIKFFPIKSGEKWGFIDEKGQYVINSQFDDAYNFSEGLALIKSAGKYGFIGEDGKYAINPIYKDANSFSEGLACVVMENGKPQFIDKDNKIRFTLDKADYCYGFKEGLAKFQLKGKYGYIDKNGKVVINAIYDDAKDFKEGLAAVAKKDEKRNEILWGYIDKTGAVKINFQFVKDKDKWIFEPGSFQDGLAFTSSDGKLWGCINKDGKYQINPQFEGEIGKPYEFVNDVSLVSQGGSYGYIDKNGKYIINPQFKQANRFSKNNYAAVQHSDGKWGFINKEGKYEINPQFEDVAIGFFGNVAFVKSSDKYGIIDKKGLYVINPQFDDVRLYDIGSNYSIKSDFVDIDGIVEMIFENSNNSSFLGYGINTNLGEIIDDYPDTDISDLNPFNLSIKKPNISFGDMVEINSLDLGFNEKTYTETPIYKNVQKYNYYNGFYNDKEFVKMDKKIEINSLLCYAIINFTLQSSGKEKGKILAESISREAIKKMKVEEITELDIKNTDVKGMYILTNNDILVSIIYYKKEDDEKSKPNITVTVVNKNYYQSFEGTIKMLVDNF